MKLLRKDQMLTLLIVSVALGAFLFIVHLPQQRQLKALTQDRREASEALERDREQAKELARLGGDVDRMTKQLAVYDRRLPDRQELGQFLKDVSTTARVAGLESTAIEPQRVAPGELYLQAPFSMKFNGKFDQLVRFMGQAKAMTRLTHIRSMTVRNDSDLSGRCNVDMVMTIYFTRG